MRLLIAALAVAMIGSTVGCGQSDTGSAASATGSAPTGAAAAIPTDPIGRVVYEFLDAVRQGNTAVAGRQLTPLALKRTSELDLVFSPPGSPTASFKVGAIEMVEKDKAVVDSVWTDLDADGKPHSEPTLWALRLTDGQWRISGMAAQMDPSQPPMVIDFENPEMMAPQKPVDPATVAGSSATTSGQQPSGGVARNPFEQSSQR